MDTQIKDAIERIQHMESLFDYLQQAAADNQTDAVYRKSLTVLTQYYENGLWLKDYTLDEQGLLPSSLKRGVLSQDGIYHFLESLQDV